METRTKVVKAALVSVACFFAAAGCAGTPQQQSNLDTRPMEETKAFEIIENMLAERGFLGARDVEIELANNVRFTCDYRVTGHPIAIEYLTEQDRLGISPIPPPASGSRLHVLPANAVSKETGAPGDAVYVFFINDRMFVYHYNPTSDHRADITFREVDSRLRRDLADFLSWYETTILNR